MCYWQAIPIALSAIQGGMSMMGQKKSAEAKQASLEFNATVQKQNSIKAERNVREIQLAGIKKEDTQRIKTANLIGQQRAGFGASGILTNAGTALDVQTGTDFMGKEDLLSVRANTLAREKAYHQQATDMTNQANLLSWEGKQAISQANSGLLGTALGTLGNIGGQAYGMGLFDGGGSSSSGMSISGATLDQPSLGDNGIY